MKFLEAKRLGAEGENKALGGPGENKSARQTRNVSSVTPNAGPTPEGPNASPQAKALAQEQGIDLTKLTGTGAGGVITTGDVRKALEERGQR